MKSRGFTLIELLATLTILGIIMAIAVPNVMSILDKNKRTTYLEDAKKLVTQAEYKFRMSQSIDKPADGECVVFRMKSLDVSEIKKCPEGSLYYNEKIFVSNSYNGSSYQYGVLIYEANKKRGVKLVNSEKLNEETAMMNYINENITSSAISLGSTISGEDFSCKVVNII